MSFEFQSEQEVRTTRNFHFFKHTTTHNTIENTDKDEAKKDASPFHHGGVRASGDLYQRSDGCR
jgi:hypothetical protein